MEKLIDLEIPQIYNVISTLLLDRTANNSIIFATDNYNDQGYAFNNHITYDSLYGPNAIDLRPRVEKSKEIQKERSKKKAEVFTPSWICNKMNNNCDEEWFGYRHVFNYETDEGKCWFYNPNLIEFPPGKTWQDYVLSNRLEITCGEAPYLVSCYDTVTGDDIPLHNRIGQLDRKIRVINENCSNEAKWYEWIVKAYQSTYGYEYQGDNLLIARINLLMTFIEYYEARWGHEPDMRQIREITLIISWNLWQMDGLTTMVPGTDIPAIIKDWKANEVIEFQSLLPEPEPQKKKSKKSK